MEPNFKEITFTRLAAYWQARAKVAYENARINRNGGFEQGAIEDQKDAATYSANARAYLYGAPGN